jgi:hypothetical protein
MTNNRPGVIFNYLGKELIESDMEYLKNNLSNNNISVGFIDQEGKIFASEGVLSNAFSLVINYPLALLLIKTIGPNAAWDAIKLFISHTWSKIRGGKYSKITSSGVEKRDISLGIRVKLNNNDYDFNIKGMETKQEVVASLDKILGFLREQNQINQEWKTYIANYNLDEKEWDVKELFDIVKEKKNLK